MFEIIKDICNNDKKQIALFTIKAIAAATVGIMALYCWSLLIIIIGG